MNVKAISPLEIHFMLSDAFLAISKEIKPSKKTPMIVKGRSWHAAIMRSNTLTHLSMSRRKNNDLMSLQISRNSSSEPCIALAGIVTIDCSQGMRGLWLVD
mmetsp:Transcript_3722/g.7721  ORF Transcript_3722/g.7721 Transcript_3722/m.7721 type:complete len:101 (-) Transcript_3722:985-1287(-)